MKIIFNNDSTTRLSFRADDMLVWFRFKNMLSKDSLSIVDMWKLKAGDHAIVTNRWDDIPPWFELHPFDVQNSLLYKMQRKLDQGYTPGSIIDGPNVWRINAGDTIVWFGDCRPEMKADEGILQTIKFYSNGLLLGESISAKSLEDAICFGAVMECSEDEINRVRDTVARLREEGMPRRYSTKWAIG